MQDREEKNIINMVDVQGVAHCLAFKMKAIELALIAG
jgi:hypothetical protein